MTSLAEQFKKSLEPLQNKEDEFDYRFTAMGTFTLFDSLWSAVQDSPAEKTAVARVLLNTLVQEAQTQHKHPTASAQGHGEVFCRMAADKLAQDGIAESIPSGEFILALKRLQGFGAHFNRDAAQATSHAKKRFSAANTACQNLAERMAILSDRGIAP